MFSLATGRSPAVDNGQSDGRARPSDGPVTSATSRSHLCDPGGRASSSHHLGRHEMMSRVNRSRHRSLHERPDIPGMRAATHTAQWVQLQSADRVRSWCGNRPNVRAPPTNWFNGCGFCHVRRALQPASPCDDLLSVHLVARWPN